MLTRFALFRFCDTFSSIFNIRRDNIRSHYRSLIWGVFHVFTRYASMCRQQYLPLLLDVGWYVFDVLSCLLLISFQSIDGFLFVSTFFHAWFLALPRLSLFSPPVLMLLWRDLCLHLRLWA